MRLPLTDPTPSLAAGVRALLVVGALVALPLGAAPAQERDSTRSDSVAAARRDSAFVARRSAGVLPRDVAAEVVRIYNAPQTLRVTGSLDVADGRQIDGDVAVLEGPVTVSGRITGRLLAINADVVLMKSARIDGDLVVVGGTVEGRADGYVGGDIRVYREVLYYREEGERIVAERDEEGSAADERWWLRWRNRRTRNRADITLSSAHTYNRVEGLPVYLGPTLRRDTPWGRVSIDALGILRSADGFRWDSENIGHRVRAEVRLGGRYGVALGGRLYDVVDAVEPWQLSDAEVGLASFFLHRDYRDYFDRHGGGGYVALRAGPDASLTVALSDERWGSRDIRDPFTLFRNEQGWRANPRLDDGRFHVATATLRFDTRNDIDNPWAGWYLVADLERGSGETSSFGARSAFDASGAPVTPTRPAGVTYTRGFVDVRRYNRIAPNASLNVRGAIGGWVAGDELPLERRLSVGGVGTLAGYDFRRAADGTDFLSCSGGGSDVPLGTPAQCDRMALAQIEYRSDLHLNFSSGGEDEDDDRRWRRRFAAEGNWVLFADAGRGWMVRGLRPMSAAPNNLVYSRSSFPELGTFRTDVGVGIDFDPIGVYVAKAVSDAKQPANFFVRVRRRF